MKLLQQFELMGSILVLGSMFLLSTGSLFYGCAVGMIAALVWAIFAYVADHGYMMILQCALFIVSFNGVLSNA